MRIDRADLYLLSLRLREPFRSSASVTHDRSVLLLRLGGEGLEGWGECVAGETPAYSPETTETAWHVLTRWLLPGIVGRVHAHAGDVLDPVGWVRGHPMARAAVEMAAWDLQAKVAGEPLHAALGGTQRPVPAGVALGLVADEGALIDRIAELLAEGYRRVKLKIEPGRDVALLERVRSRFPDTSLAADANGAYTVADRARLQALDALDLAFLEQPLPADDLVGHAEVQSGLATPICLDESIASVADARRALALGSCRMVNLKPGRVGGFGEALRVHALCRESAVPMWCGGMHETGIGRAHNVALATLPGFTLPGDLSASRRYWERDLVSPEWCLVNGALVPLETPGIGVRPDLDFIGACTVRGETFGP